MQASSKGEGGDSVYAALVRFVGHWCRRFQKFLSKKWVDYKMKRQTRKGLAGKDVQSKLLEGSADNTEMKVRGTQEDSSPADDCSTKHQNTGPRSNGSTKRSQPSQGGTTGNNLESWEEVSRRDEPNAELTEEEEALKRRRPTREFRSASLSGEENESVQKRPNTRWNSVREAVKRFSNSNHFTRGILVAILINTISMGIEHHQQPEILTITLEYTNYFFTGLFAFEMFLKIISDGVFGYMADGKRLMERGRAF